MTGAQPVRLASLTKLMTYAAVMELVKRDRLKLSDRAVSLLEPGALNGIPNAGEFTVAQLLDHKSGLHSFNGEDSRDFFRDLFADPQRGTRRWTSDELLAYAKKPEHRPSGRPGERFNYSSTGYIVLQMILERLEKKPLHQIYRQLLFEPLGMKSTGVEGADFTTSEIAHSYARPTATDLARANPFAGRTPVRADGLVNLSAGLRSYNAWAQGAGAVAAPVDDLAKFMDAVVTGSLQVLSDQAAQFARAKQKQGSKFDWNGGSWGIQTTILYEPSRDTTVIVLLNASNAGPGSRELALELLQAAN
jgi:D-alanyl-D-alanine carboxypeptidase